MPSQIDGAAEAEVRAVQHTFACTLVAFRSFLRTDADVAAMGAALDAWTRHGDAGALRASLELFARCDDVRLHKAVTDDGEALLAALAPLGSAAAVASRRDVGVACVALGLFRLGLLVPSTAVDPLLVPITKLQVVDERLADLTLELEVCVWRERSADWMRTGELD